MHLAFYAPMKPPTSAVPSGDRRIARLFMQAFAQAGHEVDLAARLRTWEGVGDESRQVRLRDVAGRLSRRLLDRYLSRPAIERPDAWFTYHVYHKAPDWIGPAVSDALDIPYLVAEASIADKRASGPWALGHAATAAAIRRADAALGLKAIDGPAVCRYLEEPGRLFQMPLFLDAAPFIDAAARKIRHRAELAERFALPPNQPWLLSVAMMRPGDKLESYRVLGKALSRLDGHPWTFICVGDGEARPDVETALAPVRERIHFVGEQEAADLPAFYAAADLMVWPAVNEAMGMALLEAQATGLPVVAGTGGGISEIVRHSETGLLTQPSDVTDFSAAVEALLADPDRRQRMGDAARAVIARDHDLPGAARRIDGILRRAVAERRK
jgi:glycosyltransferase involved in cell wall biosynthesis